MAIIRKSGKLKSDKRQSKIVAGEFVLLRVLKNDDDTYWVWTATAAEYDRSHKAFPNQNLLMDTAETEFRPIAAKIIPKADDSGRPYREFHDVDDPKALHDAANRLAEKLGLDPTTSGWIDAEAREELKEIWSEFSVDDESDAYLMDEATVSKSGRFYGGNS
jgi:hypothetical protein